MSKIAEDYQQAADKAPPKSLKLPEIEVLKYEYRGQRVVVRYVFPELTTLCPKTGLPDFYKLVFLFEPDQIIPELKSLKLYLVAWRDKRIFHEHLVNRILNDLVKTINPKWAYLELFTNPRGGVTTTCHKGHNISDKKLLEMICKKTDSPHIDLEKEKIK